MPVPIQQVGLEKACPSNGNCQEVAEFVDPSTLEILEFVASADLPDRW
jgi:hypothetical protein